MARPRIDPLIRFWSHVEKRGKDDCWIWKSALDKNGYGLFCLEDRKNARAARYSYVLHNQKGNPSKNTRHLSRKTIIMHSCDNPPCVNPRHLIKGTILQNNRDRWLKKRFTKVWNQGKKMPKEYGDHISKRMKGRRLSTSHKRAIGAGLRKYHRDLDEGRRRNIRQDRYRPGKNTWGTRQRAGPP